jgi:proline iminopeptidase
VVVEEVEVQRARLWTASQGAGPALVVCHGGPGLSDNLKPVAEMVDDLALVHRYDQRGSGRSRSDSPLDVATFVADLEALRRHWGHERWLVGGHSWGANLALCYALTHPDRTAGVIYLAGSGLRAEGRDAVRRARLARLTKAEREELTTAGTDRFLQLMWTTDFADRRVAARALEAGPLYQWPRDEDVFAAVTRSFQELVDRGLRRADSSSSSTRPPLERARARRARAFIREPLGR